MFESSDENGGISTFFNTEIMNTERDVPMITMRVKITVIVASYTQSPPVSLAMTLHSGYEMAAMTSAMNYVLAGSENIVQRTHANGLFMTSNEH